MSTRAIFARGSCRALRWMALAGMVFALGAGSAAAQALTSKPVLTVKGKEAGQVTLSWTMPGGGAPPNGGFVYQVALSSSPAFTALLPVPEVVDNADVAARTVDAAELDADMEYRFRVGAIGPGGDAARTTWSDTKNFTPEALPEIPAEFTVTSGDKMVTLAWTSRGDGDYYEYIVVLGTSPTTVAELTAAQNKTWQVVPGGSGASSVNVPNLTNGASYRLGLRAVNKAGNTPVANLMPGEPSGKPGALTGLTATPGTPIAGKVTVTLAWNEPDDGGSDILNYEYQVLKADSTVLLSWRLTGTTTTFSDILNLDAALVDGYTYRVRAQNLHGVGPIASATTGGTTPIVPGALTFASVPGDLTLPAGAAMKAVQLPAVTAGGTPPYTYMVGILPPGLTFDPDTRMLTGTPATAAAAATVTYTATDSAALIGRLTFRITVAAAGTAPGTGSGPAFSSGGLQAGQRRRDHHDERARLGRRQRRAGQQLRDTGRRRERCDESHGAHGRERCQRYVHRHLQQSVLDGIAADGSLYNAGYKRRRPHRRRG